MPDGHNGKRTVTVTVELDAELVEAAALRDGTIDMSIEHALRRHLGGRTRMTDDEIAAFVTAANERYDRYGLAGEEFMPV